MFETEAIRENYELGVMAGGARERKRIIKVVEGYLHHDYLTGQNEDEILDELYLSELIALINEERSK